MSKEEAKGEKKNGYNSFLATQIRMILNILKGGKRSGKYKEKR